MAQLNAALAAATPGETILLAAGTYSGVSIVNQTVAGSVNIASQDASHEAVITSMTLNGSSGFNFNNVEFSAAGSTDPYYGFRVYGSTNIHFSNVSVHGTLDNNSANDTGGFLVSGGGNISFTGSEFQQLSNGIVFSNVNGESVVGSSFHDLSNDGIDNSGSSNVLISQNQFTNFQPGVGTHPDAIQFWTYGTTNTPTNIVISDNTITRGSGAAMQGIFMGDDVGTLPYTNVTISGNTLTGTMYNGIMLAHATNATIANNTVTGLSDMVSWIQAANITGGSLSNNSAQYYTLSGNTNFAQTGNQTIAAAVATATATVSPSDTVIASTSTTLTSTTHTLILTGTSALTGLGNDLGDHIIGNSGADTLIGGASSDVIVGNVASDMITGGAGNDILAGGGGLDTFIFSAGSGHDVITDYQAGYALDLSAYVNSGHTPTVADTPQGLLVTLDATDSIQLLGIHTVSSALASSLQGHVTH